MGTIDDGSRSYAPLSDHLWGRGLESGAVERSPRLRQAERALRALIEAECPGLAHGVKIRFTDNSCTMVSKYLRDGVTHLRVHHLFARAPVSLLRTLVRFCFGRITRKTSRTIRAHLMDFVEAHREETLSVYPRSRRLPPRGEHYDLEDVLEKVRRQHVRELKSQPEVAWTRRAHRTLMGKWIPNPPPHANLILVNRLLDCETVPAYYLEFIVFHELLHELMPISRSCGRWVHHPPEFRRRERRFPHFDRAQRWEGENLSRLYTAYRGRQRT